MAIKLFDDVQYPNHGQRGVRPKSGDQGAPMLGEIVRPFVEVVADDFGRDIKCNESISQCVEEGRFCDVRGVMIVAATFD